METMGQIGKFARFYVLRARRLLSWVLWEHRLFYVEMEVCEKVIEESISGNWLLG